jgi:hypothetical protein
MVESVTDGSEAGDALVGEVLVGTVLVATAAVVLAGRVGGDAACFPLLQAARSRQTANADEKFLRTSPTVLRHPAVPPLNR